MTPLSDSEIMTMTDEQVEAHLDLCSAERSGVADLERRIDAVGTVLRDVRTDHERLTATLVVLSASINALALDMASASSLAEHDPVRPRRQNRGAARRRRP